jgi:sRNA-binding regulator protein Hfq
MAKSKTRAPETTHEEGKYLRYLADKQIPVRVKLTDDSELDGTVEFFDEGFIRLTRHEGEPNLFIYKHDIKYLQEMK